MARSLSMLEWDGRARIHGVLDRRGCVHPRVHVMARPAASEPPGADYTTVNKLLGLAIFQEWYEMYLA
jgi:hypothetical protein